MRDHFHAEGLDDAAHQAIEYARQIMNGAAEQARLRADRLSGVLSSLDDASSVVDKGEDEDYAYQAELVDGRSLKNEIEDEARAMNAIWRETKELLAERDASPHLKNLDSYRINKA